MSWALLAWGIGAVLAVCATGGAVTLGRYFPSLPVFNRMVLRPEPSGGAEPDVAALVSCLIDDSGIGAHAGRLRVS